ncbi:MAG TPA: hypothetical protein P5102_02030 [Candidatus Competibacteraceae bacterium]|nr:hypothetical protein [Candidatus Competibacteraceae bacterium]HRZ04925.1 hypothetical protein [Candidatus Competibacteraceae bacterium]HSA45363.1 hypothetical protein [Candidatus Competibacteraceae bacterium]
MPSTISLSKAAVRGGLTGLLLLAAPFLVGADDAYLREIEEEAKRQAGLLIANPVPANPTTPDVSPTEAATDRLAAGLDQAGLDQALRETLPGTYALYQQFDPARKKQVYEAYQNDNRLAGISEKVIQLLSAKP